MDWPEKNGTFNICTFWLVESLTRAGRTDRRRLERARVMFEEMLGYANHLGLCPSLPSRPAIVVKLGQFSSSLHTPGAHQCRVQPRPCPGK